jgi:GAF domain-containing protein
MTNETENRIPLADLLVFHQLTRSLTSSFDLDTILRTILEHMERIIEAELWTLLMLDEATQELYYAIAAGGEQEALREPAREGGRGRGRLGGRARRDADRSRGGRRPAPEQQSSIAKGALGDCHALARAQGHPRRHRDFQPARRPDDRLHHRLSAHPGRPRGHRH